MLLSALAMSSRVGGDMFPPVGGHIFIPEAHQVLEDLQTRLGKSWGPVLDLMYEMKDLPPQPDVNLLPPIERYRSRDEHHALLRDVLWALSSEVKDDAKVCARPKTVIYMRLIPS